MTRGRTDTISCSKDRKRCHKARANISPAPGGARTPEMAVGEENQNRWRAVSGGFTDTLSGKKWRGKMAKARADIPPVFGRETAAQTAGEAGPTKLPVRTDGGWFRGALIPRQCRSARERRKRRGKRGHQNRQRAVNKRPTDTIWDSDQKARQFWIEQERRKRRERQGIKNAGAQWIDGRFT
ncbi:hypothetical protein C8R44DRAFT_845730 [Mycena epipterygia]|nr:hypothetical protein C8R44DRAFT_845730 [Mycena epipterygia]